MTHGDGESRIREQEAVDSRSLRSDFRSSRRGAVEHNLVEMLLLALCDMVCGVDDYVGIEAWGNERIDWLRRFLKLENGIPSHDTLGRLFGLLDRKAVEKSFCNWLIGAARTINGKTSRERRLYQQHRPR
ncbi:MAG: transposase family protein [Propionivibrio sp.]|nr:transposase family protein [Propionivibrio sp.]